MYIDLNFSSEGLFIYSIKVIGTLSLNLNVKIKAKKKKQFYRRKSFITRVYKIHLYLKTSQVNA